MGEGKELKERAMRPRHLVRLLGIFLTFLIASSGEGAVSANEAARLKGELTPVGAERAGNKEGTIPPWDGGYTTVPPGYRSGDPRPDPFAHEKPLFRITAASVKQYADRLSEGTKELLAAYPTYRVDVYPTHRTAAAPQWVYDNVFRNATRAKAERDGLTVSGAYGGTPFPIPKTGREAMWNHLLAWKGEATADVGTQFFSSGAGKPVLTFTRRADFQYPYYYREGADRFRGIYEELRVRASAPPARAGDGYVSLVRLDRPKHQLEVWAYVAGQRRARAVPALTYDNPDESSGSISTVDEYHLFYGPLDRYDWQLLGKREMVVPYNVNGLQLKDVDQVVGVRHPNPDHLRWEVHRVWVVEARLPAGKRHLIAKRRIYLDEDTWIALLYDGWDGKGRLRHAAHALPMVIPDLPGVVSPSAVYYDLEGKSYSIGYIMNGSGLQYQLVPPRREDFFTPAALAGEGVR